MVKGGDFFVAAQQMAAAFAAGASIDVCPAEYHIVFTKTVP
jgi:hypothetical protein